MKSVNRSQLMGIHAYLHLFLVGSTFAEVISLRTTFNHLGTGIGGWMNALASHQCSQTKAVPLLCNYGRAFKRSPRVFPYHKQHFNLKMSSKSFIPSSFASNRHPVAAWQTNKHGLLMVRLSNSQSLFNSKPRITFLNCSNVYPSTQTSHDSSRKLLPYTSRKICPSLN